jgi:Tol biopolymer transport system component
MSLAAGARLGPYEIVSPLGAGGMGEVYKARDTRLDRTVAIKVLPESLATDVEFRDRFDREARVISQLSHPHICTLFDVGDLAGPVPGGGDGGRYLVLEYLEGETLADRITRGPLKSDEALRIAVEIAEALNAAHRAGIIHRDLKPGNVMLTKAGSKLLDFGLAKNDAATAGSGRHLDLTAPPTMSSPLTMQGTILGTVQYMAPEQIEGRDADARSDIWAFGCIVHEMLTARKAFEGRTHAGVIGAILEREPAVAASIPPRLSWFLSRCVAKNPDERWQHAGDMLHVLARLHDTEDQVTAKPVPRSHAPTLIAGTIAVLALAALAGVLVTRRDGASAPPLRVTVLPNEGTEVAPGPAAPQAAISPDGTRIVFAAIDADRTFRLYVRPLDALQARPVAGTDQGELPFWSPDGRYVAFFTADRKLKRVAVDGGPPQTICDLPGPAWGGGTWNRDGVILIGGGTNQSIYRVSASGGTPQALTTLDRARQHNSHVWPAFLPDGRTFIFLVTSPDPQVRGIYLASLEAPRPVRVLETTVRALVAPPNYLLFVRDGTLLAQSLDPATARLLGEPTAVAENVAYNPTISLGRTAATVSNNGVLVFRSGEVGGLLSGQLTWFDRRGAVLGPLGPPAPIEYFAFSRDGRRLALGLYDRRSRQSDVYVMDPAVGTPIRLTFEAADEDFPLWSPQGDRVVFSSGAVNLRLKPSTGAADATTLLETSTIIGADAWSPDGQFLVYEVLDPRNGSDLWLLPLEGDRRPRPLLQTQTDEYSARLSPDGRWFAYGSNESGASEVYVQPFPTTGAKWQISRGGGTWPQWRADGQELYYLSPNQTLMAVEVKGGASFQSSSTPTPLFRLASSNVGGNDYLAAPDGRFLVNVQQQTGTTMTVVTDWRQRLK